MSGKKLPVFISYTVAALLLAGGGLCFYELFLYEGRHSFFSFNADFLSCCLPWRSDVYMFPGQPYSFGDLLRGFSGQFYRGWGVVLYLVVAGLIFCAILTWLCRLVCLHRGRNRRWKRLVRLVLPVVGALVFLGCQLYLAFSGRDSYWGIKDYSLGRILMKTERLVAEQKYGETLELANQYWFSHPCSIDDVVTGRNSLYAGLKPVEIPFRLDLAAYTHVALLGAHRLNEDFFTYYRVPEIYGQIGEADAPAGILVSVFKNRLIGNHTVVYSQLMNLMEAEGLSYFSLEQSIFSALVCYQYGLADKYIRLLESTLFYRKAALRYREVSVLLQNPEAKRKEVSPTTLKLLEQIEKERNKSLVDYIYTSGLSEMEARELWRQRTGASLENLEYIALMDLLYKNTDSVVARIPDYLRLSAQDRPPYRLPAAWQELLLVLAQENRVLPEKVAALMPDMAWDNAVLKQLQLFYGERERLMRRMSSPQQITQAFGHTFAYNYYFSRFVRPQPSQSAKPLAH